MKKILKPIYWTLATIFKILSFIIAAPFVISGGTYRIIQYAFMAGYNEVEDKLVDKDENELDEGDEPGAILDD